MNVSDVSWLQNTSLYKSFWKEDSDCPRSSRCRCTLVGEIGRCRCCTRIRRWSASSWYGPVSLSLYHLVTWFWVGSLSVGFFLKFSVREARESTKPRPLVLVPNGMLIYLSTSIFKFLLWLLSLLLLCSEATPLAESLVDWSDSAVGKDKPSSAIGAAVAVTETASVDGNSSDDDDKQS